MRDDDTGNAYYFTFDKIPGYRGESAKEAGIKVGSHATFATQGGSLAVTKIMINRDHDQLTGSRRGEAGGHAT